MFIKLLHSICNYNDKSEKDAVICAESGYSLTYMELTMATYVLAKKLIEVGILIGKPVVLLFPTSIESVISFFSVIAAGSIAAPVDRYMKSSAFEGLMDFMNPSAIITNEALCRKISKDVFDKYPVITLNANSKFNEKIMVLRIYKNSSEFVIKEICYDKISYNRIKNSKSMEKEIQPDDDVIFITTSGTTANPKIVRLSYNGVLENIRMNLESLEIKHTLIGIQTLELSYSYGLIASFLSILYSHGTVVLISRLDIPFICSSIQKYRVNFWVGTPSLFRYLIDNIDSSLIDLLDPLRKITIGGDHCSSVLREKICKVLGEIDINITYGTTEAGPRISTLPARNLLDKENSVGLPLSGVELRIVGEDNKECSVGEVGQLAVKSPSLMLGYYGNDHKTDEILCNGWYLTGDLARIDEDGFLYLRGRIDNQIKLRGRRIDPKVVEDCIFSYPGVIDVAIRKAGEDGDTYINAEVICEDDSVSQAELKRHCFKNLPLYMVPEKFYFIPRNKYYFKGKCISYTETEVTGKEVVRNKIN